MKGVMIGSKLSEGVALLGRMGGGAAQGAPMLTATAGWAFIAAGGTVPRVTISLTGLALSNAGGFNPMQVTGGTNSVASGDTIPGEMGLGTVTAENTSSGLRTV
jgi:hypothetical protein